MISFLLINKYGDTKTKLDQEFINLAKLYIKRKISNVMKYEILYFTKEISKIEKDKLIFIKQELLDFK